jgi:hypothetical protein
MALPGKFFTDRQALANDIEMFESSEDLTNAINSGEFNLEQFLDDNTVEPVPSSTLLPAPKIDVKPNESTPNNTTNPIPGPSQEEVEKLEQIEGLLVGLEKKISDLSKEDSLAPDQPKKMTSEELLEQKLNEPLGGESEKIEILPQNNNVFNNNNQTTIDERQFNQQKLNEYIQQYEQLNQERNTILQAYNKTDATTNQINNNTTTMPGIIQENISNESNLTDNTNISTNNNQANQNLKTENSEILNTNTNNVTNKNEIENVFNQSTNETPSTPLATNTAQSQSLAPSPVSDLSVKSDTQNITNTDNSISSVDNSITENLPSEPVPTVGMDEANKNIENEVMAVAQESENISNQIKQDIENVFEQPENILENSLPPGQDMTGETAKQITAILESIKEAVVGVGDKLGDKFAGLSSDIKGIKTSINNTYNNSSKTDTTSMNSNQMSQRNTIPNYVGDYPEPGDFPTGFDLTKLGGSNNPNPSAII